jgi:hypothetical protein
MRLRTRSSLFILIGWTMTKPEMRIAALPFTT